MRNRVREQRTQRGLSQAEVAAALGVSRQTVISIEGGRYLPSLPLAFAIARFFDITVDKMFDPAESPSPSRHTCGADGETATRMRWPVPGLMSASSLSPSGRGPWPGRSPCSPRSSA
jgi:putative transcriptional regulator